MAVDVDLVSALPGVSIFMPTVLGSVSVKLVARVAPAEMNPHSRVSNAILVERSARADIPGQWYPEHGNVGPLLQFLSDEDINIAGLADVKRGATPILCRACYDERENATPG